MKSGMAKASLTYLTLAFLLGGASSQGLLGNALLQVLGVGLIAWLLLSAPAKCSAARNDPRVGWVGAAAALLACAQFLPLPPTLWTRLPGRELLRTGFALLEVPLPWQTLSMSPWSSLSSLAWCIPALATFLATRSSRGPSLTAVALLVSVLAGLSIALGIEQVISGNFYLYETTNFGTPVGFFSNVNHEAAFIVCALVWWAIYNYRDCRQSKGASPGRKVIFYGVSLYFVIGVILCGSLAGLGLLALATVGIWLLIAGRARARPVTLIGMLGLSVIGALAYAYGGSNLAAIFVDSTQPGMSRLDFWKNGLTMLIHYLPTGSGLGTFEELYHLVEDPQVVDIIYVNHAHNDYLELLIEAGFFGALMLGAFFVWFGNRAINCFRLASDFGSRASCLIIVVLLLHSLVDYPLRTAALSSLFAATLGFLARPSINNEKSSRPGKKLVNEGDRRSAFS